MQSKEVLENHTLSIEIKSELLSYLQAVFEAVIASKNKNLDSVSTFGAKYE